MAPPPPFLPQARLTHLYRCCICQLEFEEDEPLKLLPCTHYYHPECIRKWLGVSKACPICNVEVGQSAKE